MHYSAISLCLVWLPIKQRRLFPLEKFRVRVKFCSVKIKSFLNYFSMDRVSVNSLDENTITPGLSQSQVSMMFNATLCLNEMF